MGTQPRLESRGTDQSSAACLSGVLRLTRARELMLCRIKYTSLTLLISLPSGTSFSSSTAVTSAKVAVNGVHLHYQRTGEGEHAVLLLPGMLGMCGFE